MRKLWGDVISVLPPVSRHRDKMLEEVCGIKTSWDMVMWWGKEGCHTEGDGDERSCILQLCTDWVDPCDTVRKQSICSQFPHASGWGLLCFWGILASPLVKSHVRVIQNHRYLRDWRGTMRHGQVCSPSADVRYKLAPDTGRISRVIRINCPVGSLLWIWL